MIIGKQVGQVSTDFPQIEKFLSRIENSLKTVIFLTVLLLTQGMSVLLSVCSSLSNDTRIFSRLNCYMYI